jgi:hypothetical protein
VRLPLLVLSDFCCHHFSFPVDRASSDSIT